MAPGSSPVCLGAGAQVQTLGFHPGAFAENHVEQGARGSRGVIYPRAALRLTAGRRGPLLWLRRARALTRAIRASRRVWVVQGPGLAERALTVALRLAAWRRLTLLPLAGPPHLLARRICPCPQPLPELVPEAAMQACFEHIRAHGGDGIRLTMPAIEAALSRAPELATHHRSDLRTLAEAAQAVRPQILQAALTLHRHRALEQPSRAVQAALAVAPGAPVPRIVEHLRQSGAPKALLRNWPQPPTPEPEDGSLAAVVLRHLTGKVLASDLADLRALALPALPGARLTRLDWFLMAALRLPAPSLAALRAPWDSPEMLTAVSRKQLAPEPAVSVIGIAANDTGLAQNFWMSAQALQMAGLRPRLQPLDAPPATLSTLAPPAPPLLPARSITLSHMGADRVPQALLDSAAARQGYNIGFLLWELDRLPREHLLALEMLDEVWVPSMFLHRLYRRRTDRPVVFMRKGIALPAPAPFPGPPQGVQRFLVCFDQRASVARKNPLAALRAFGRAFAGREDVELVIKTTPVAPGHWGDPEGQMTEIRRRAAADPRIRLIEAQLPLPELLGLIHSADCLVSPHRAEGFGYLPAFALGLGVPVVVTDYSGTQDFCTPLTAYPVAAEPVKVPEGHAILRTPGAHWAEIDAGALAATLAHVAANPSEARARARAGQLVMQTDYAMAAQAQRYRARLAELGLVHQAPPMETEERA